MRFTKMLPALLFASMLGLSACAEEGVEEGDELTPADTAAMEMEMPPAADDPMMDGMDDEAVDDTLLTDGDTVVM